MSNLMMKLYIWWNIVAFHFICHVEHSFFLNFVLINLEIFTLEIKDNTHACIVNIHLSWTVRLIYNQSMGMLLILVEKKGGNTFIFWKYCNMMLANMKCFKGLSSNDKGMIYFFILLVAVLNQYCLHRFHGHSCVRTYKHLGSWCEIM